jgi:hypothetical protein
MARKTVTNPPSDIAVSAHGAGGDGADALARMAGQERRLHARAYHHWASLLGEARFPTIQAFDAGATGDFASNSVLLDFRGNRVDARIAHIGAALRQECGIDGRLPERIADIPAHSLLARLTAHCDQILTEQAPAGFEAEFVNERGHTILYRGILLPYSSDGLMIDFVHGVVSWKEVADPLLQASLDSALLDSVAGLDVPAPTSAPPRGGAGLWQEDHAPRGPSGLASILARVPLVTGAAPGTPVVLAGHVADDGTVAVTGSVVGDERLADRVLRASQ